MLKKYISKFTIDILPSVAATVIGAYIVNHYIVTRPGTDAPVAAAVSAADPKAPAKAAETGNPPTAGVRAKGISEKALLEKTAAERPAVVEKVEAKADVKADVKPEVKADAKSADAPAETARVPAEPRATRAAPREREKEKIRVVLPSPVQPVAPAVAAAPPAPVAAPPVETAVVPDDRRDANDLARAAIERLRVNNDGSPRAPEVVRTPEAQRVETPRIETPRSETPRVATAPALRPLPPPISVSTPSGGESFDQGRPPYAANASVDPRRPTPPAEIPVSRPLDLRADVPEPSVRERTTAVAEDVLSAAKSVFHAVLPK
ncbi:MULTISPECIES: hypothetical protein [unclassified Bradyrhizobium]|uniref:hypothetical protein n=1 Tax=unclassified Bradyrhizobium TaxID=2631580 RepID=UPI002899BE8A|nr:MULTISPECIES: hypothetical protein [unclassified Bradyrhizobium]